MKSDVGKPSWYQIKCSSRLIPLLFDIKELWLSIRLSINLQFDRVAKSNLIGAFGFRACVLLNFQKHWFTMTPSLPLVYRHLHFPAKERERVESGTYGFPLI